MTWLEQVMADLSDAHQNLVDHALFTESRDLTPAEHALLSEIDAAYLHANEMRLQAMNHDK